MLSICIPVYNCRIEKLVAALHNQLTSLSLPAEIILIDDGSDLIIRMENKKACGTIARLFELNENTGRSAIRNLFLRHSTFENLLFLDCDSEITNDLFLEDYLAHLKPGYGVICGGRIYPANRPAHDKLLHWKYGRNKESRPASQRTPKPYKSFMTNNFMINKPIFEYLKFDERLKGYGHEDTLFGFQLQQSGIPVLHIDNPVLHGQLETNEVFLSKTREALQQLIRVLEFTGYNKSFIRTVSILRTYFRIRKFGLHSFFKMLGNPISRFVGQRLQKGNPPIWYFSLYKLCMFSKYYQSRS